MIGLIHPLEGGEMPGRAEGSGRTNVSLEIKTKGSAEAQPASAEASSSHADGIPPPPSRPPTSATAADGWSAWVGPAARRPRANARRGAGRPRRARSDRAMVGWWRAAGDDAGSRSDD